MQQKQKKNYNKIGILGGTFDPPHIGHLHVSKIALKKLKLNKIFWIVTKQNPLKKKPHFNKTIRINLSKKITNKDKKIFVKYIDNNIKTYSTFSLLKFLKKKNKNTELYFLMGADNLVNFHKWEKWKKIPSLAKLIVFARSKYKNLALKSIAAKKLKKTDWLYISGKKVDISSSLIRKFW